MEPTALEIEISKVAYLLEETEGYKFSKADYENKIHPSVYGKCDKVFADNLTRRLCTFLKKHNSLGYSLEMQIWWRDHKHKDKQRELAEKQAAKAEKTRKKALSKLTRAEKKALGL